MHELTQRVERLEADLAEVRRHNLRLAELADLVQELLLPMADQDRERIDRAIEKFQDSI
ncbi:DUF6752 domain-containing protein [Nocardioides hankookensis]|uniref:DUF6752 domain-containing protein n=1 Tax=unclassified Nocardioides TaxID=2615069 RepID=UPI0012E3F3B3|nr:MULTISPECIES: DUF6752 domain-containing protein [unclassified Nocardioides]